MILLVQNSMQAANNDPQRGSLPLELENIKHGHPGPVVGKNQDRKVTMKLFKKKEGAKDLEKRCWSSEGMKLIKRSTGEQTTAKKQPMYEEQGGEGAIRRSPTLTESQNLPSNSAKPPLSSRGLVFNKFSSEQRKKIQQYLLLLKDQTSGTIHSEAMTYLINKIRIYIEQLQDNNSKLLEVNYFFQKQFSRVMTEKVRSVEKCRKDYCLECRYHLEKENRWKQEKREMAGQLERLKQESSCGRLQKTVETSSQSILILGGSQPQEPAIVDVLKQQIQKLSARLLQKDEQYLILVKQFTYLDTINKDIKSRLSKLIEEYKYLSIQNRTLLNAKAKLLEKELECTKIKSERDQFKKKMIDLHKRMQREQGEESSEEEQGCRRCRGKEPKRFNGQESVFTLSSMSTERHRSEINMAQFS